MRNTLAHFILYDQQDRLLLQSCFPAGLMSLCGNNTNNVISLWFEIITDIILWQLYIPLSVCPCLVLSLYITLFYYCYQPQGSSPTESSEKHGALSCIPLHHKLGSEKNQEASCAVLISTWKHRTEAALAVCRCSHKGGGTLRNSVWADFSAQPSICLGVLSLLLSVCE